MAWYDDFNSRADVAPTPAAIKRPQPVKSAPAKAQPKSRNSWVKWLPTAAAVGGTLAAAPFTGGASLLGTAAILGGAGLAGGALGEFGAQALSHEDINAGKIAKEGAVSGALSAIPLGGVGRAMRVANPERAIVPKLKLPDNLDIFALAGKGGKPPVNHTSFADLKRLSTKRPELGQNGLPPGWSMSPKGDPINPSGKLATSGEFQEAVQAPHLTAFEHAAQMGTPEGKRIMDDLRKAFPDEQRFNIGDAGTKAGLTGRTLKKSTGGRLTSFGNRALASQYGTISRPVARATDPSRTLGELADAGLTKPADVERVARAITGGDGMVTKAVSDAAGGAKGVDVSNLRRTFEDSMDNLGIVDKDRKSLTMMFDAQMNKLSGGAAGSINPKVNPTEALDTMKAFEKRAAALSGKGETYSLPTPERLDQAKALKLVRDELEDRLYVGAGANANLGKILTPEFGNTLKQLQPGNKQWAKYVNEKILGAKTVGELRSSMAPFVRGGKIIDEGELNAMTAGGRMGNFANAPTIKGAIGTGLTNMVKNPAARASAAAARGTGKLLDGHAVGLLGKVRPAAGETAKQSIGRAFAGEPPLFDPAAADPTEEALASEAGVPQDIDAQAAALAAGLGPDAMSGATPEAGGDQYGGGGSLYDSPDQLNEALSIAALQALQAGDKEGLNNILQTASLMQSIQKMKLDQQAATAPGNNVTKVTAQQMGLAQNGANALQDLAAMIQNDPGVITRTATPGRGLPVVGGYVANAAGVADYDAIGYNIADAILRLRTGAQANASEIKNLQTKLMPRAGDSEDVINTKLGQINDIFGNVLQMGQQSGTGNDLSALLQQAQAQGVQ